MFMEYDTKCIKLLSIFQYSSVSHLTYINIMAYSICMRYLTQFLEYQTVNVCRTYTRCIFCLNVVLHMKLDRKFDIVIISCSISKRIFIFKRHSFDIMNYLNQNHIVTITKSKFVIRNIPYFV